MALQVVVELAQRNLSKREEKLLMRCAAIYGSIAAVYRGIAVMYGGIAAVNRDIALIYGGIAEREQARGKAAHACRLLCQAFLLSMLVALLTFGRPLHRKEIKLLDLLPLAAQSVRNGAIPGQRAGSIPYGPTHLLCRVWYWRGLCAIILSCVLSGTEVGPIALYPIFLCFRYAMPGTNVTLPLPYCSTPSLLSGADVGYVLRY
eukprot:6849-Rhodomonas_salina.5